MIAIKAYNYTPDTLTGTPVTTTFGYNRDKLTSFGGATIAYNAIGCPTTYDGLSAAWVRGKLSQLTGGTAASGTRVYRFGYNAMGQRVSKTYSFTEGTLPNHAGMLIGSDKRFYYDHSGRLIAECTTKEHYSTDDEQEKIVFLYDGNTIIGMQYTLNGTTGYYYFHRNPLGDVVGIYDMDGTLVAKYIYDAWGNCTISGDTTDITVAHANPIRYRGYYYDEETGLYYCNARYYSPKWRRFISPDDTAYLDPYSVNGLNQYCYCGNDPINYADPSGRFAITSLLIAMGIGFGVGFAVGGAFEIGKQIYANGWNLSNWNWAQIGLSALGGGVAGAISAIPIPGSGFFSYLGTFAVGGVASVAGGWISGSVNNLETAVFAFALGGFANVVGRGISDLVKHIKVSHQINTIASEANIIANMSAKQKSLTIWNMIGMDNFSRNAYKNWGYEQIFDLLITKATNVSAIYATSNLLRYGIYSAIVSSLMSGWY